MPSKKILRHVLAIAVLSFVVGFVTNFSLIRKYIKGEFRQSFLARDKYPGITFISLSETEQLFSQKVAVFVDARSKEEYVSGHILRALNLPLEEAQRGKAGDRLRASLDRTLVVYCQGGDCGTSISLAKILYESGFKDIKVFQGGWTEWKAAGLPGAEGNDPE